MKYLPFFSSSALVTVLAAMIYISVQQSYRMGANDPQVQVARDLSRRLQKQAADSRSGLTDSVDIASSLSLFTVRYDEAGRPLWGTGLLDGKLPALPPGVFATAASRGEDQLTWQPRPGIRIALVVSAVASPGHGYVAAGRSLREVENRIANLNMLLLMGWLFCLGIVLLSKLLPLFFQKNQIQHHVNPS